MSNSKFEILSISIIKLFMLAEILLSLFLLYQLFGLWWSAGFAVALIVGTVISVWSISAVYIKADPLKDQELWWQQNNKATYIFYSVTENILFFPIRGVIVYYIYNEYKHGVLYILLYLLFLVGDSRARQHRNAMEANIAFNDIKNT